MPRRKYVAKTETGQKVFIRYPNRKFYDLAAKKYINLLAIVMDCPTGSYKILQWQTGEDITNLCIVSAVFHLWNKQPERFPTARNELLKGLLSA